MDQTAADERNRAALQKVYDRYGPGMLEKVRALILERAESFPDRDRPVKWTIRIDPATREITLDVRP